MATERQGLRSFAELESLYPDVQQLKVDVDLTTINKTAEAPADSGVPTAIDLVSVTDTTKAWTTNEFVDKVVKLTNADAEIAYLLVSSNTSNRLVFDSDIPIELSTSYEIMDTLVLVSHESVVSMSVIDYSCAVVLPAVSATYERKQIKIYIERATNGDHQVPIIARDGDTIRGNKYVTLEHRYEGADFYVHTLGVPHYDILSIVGVNRYIRGHYTTNVSLASATYVEIIPTTSIMADYIKRFTQIDRAGKAWARYNSVVPTIFEIRGLIHFEKIGVGDSVVDVVVRVKRKSTGLVEDLTSDVATIYLSKDGKESAHVELLVELNKGDEVTLIGRRNVGTINILATSSIAFTQI